MGTGKATVRGCVDASGHLLPGELYQMARNTKGLTPLHEIPEDSVIVSREEAELLAAYASHSLLEEVRSAVSHFRAAQEDAQFPKGSIIDEEV